MSSCLLGEPVRFNGGHSRDRFLTDDLDRYVEWVPVCPEIEIGLGAPRETLQLTAAGRLVSPSGHDHTDAMTALPGRRRGDLAGLSGYVVKSRSPSCGLSSVRVHSGSEPGGPPDSRPGSRSDSPPGRSPGSRPRDAIVAGNGRGVFAARLMAEDPLLPAEEAGRLNDPLLRETFVERVFARARLGRLFGSGWRVRDLIDFHARHKLQLMAHDPVLSRQAGHLVATARDRRGDTVREQYTVLFAQALARKVSRGRHGNALHHAFGLISELLDDTRRHDILATIDAYRRGELPLSVPVTLLRHHAEGCRAGYLAAQTYLDPFPAGLSLRNYSGPPARTPSPPARSRAKKPGAGQSAAAQVPNTAQAPDTAQAPKRTPGPKAAQGQREGASACLGE